MTVSEKMMIVDFLQKLWTGHQRQTERDRVLEEMLNDKDLLSMILYASKDTSISPNVRLWLEQQYDRVLATHKGHWSKL